MSPPQDGHLIPSTTCGSFAEKSKLILIFPPHPSVKRVLAGNFFFDLETKPSRTSVLPFVIKSRNSSSERSRPAIVPMEKPQPVLSFFIIAAPIAKRCRYKLRATDRTGNAKLFSLPQCLLRPFRSTAGSVPQAVTSDSVPPCLMSLFG